MHITSKGQVTIPQEIRTQLGLLPHTEVEFEFAGDHARIRKKKHMKTERTGRGRLAVGAIRGTADAGISTNEIMAMTRAEPKRPKQRR